MKQISRFSLIAVFAAMIAVASASDATAHVRDDGDVKKIVDKTKKLYKETKTAKITFSQSGGTGSASGTLEYASGNKYRLEMGNQTIVSDGKKTWTYTKSQNQVVINKAASKGQLTPNDLLRSFPGDYTTTLDGSGTVGGESVWIVKCSAKGTKKVGDISSATLYIDKDDNRFKKITVVSPSLGTTTLTIKSAQYNATIASSRFTFTHPDDAKVIDLSK